MKPQTNSTADSLVVRLDHDASAFVAKTLRGRSPGQAASLLVSLGYATLHGDVDSVKILSRWINTAEDVATATAALRSMPPPRIPAGVEPPPPSRPRAKTIPPAPPLHVRQPATKKGGSK